MALKTYKPTTPGQRQLVLVDRSELWKGEPVKALTEGKRGKGGRNNIGRITAALARRRPQAALPHRRFQAHASSTCRPRSCGSNTIRTAAAFIALIKLRGRRARLHPGAAAPEGGRQGRLGRARRREAGQRHADAQHPGRHHHPQCRDEAGQGRPARPRRRHLRPARRPRRRLCAAAARPRARCAWCAPNAWRRSARSRTPTSRTSRSARPAATAGSAGARRCAAWR